VRAFSSGCIRLEQPQMLAEVLLAADGQPAERLAGALASGKTTRINLKTPVPVHLTYLTAWIGEGGTVEFRDDIYGRDKLLAAALGL
jgi:murein L,D-transpeptidase YcbB/YkuD